MQAINRLLSQNCNCYPHLFRCSTIKYHKLLPTFVERPLCCLAFITLIHCSVFKVQSPAFVKARNKYSISLNPYFRAYSDWWARVGSNHRPYDYQSYALASWATGPFILFGGDSRDRTGDLLLARQALSQLSYIPKLSSFAGFAYTL